MTKSSGLKKTTRRGVAIAEFAMICPLFFMFMFALVEFGRAMMVIQSLEDAASRGCRAAIMDGTSQEGVEDIVANSLSGSGISN